MRVLCIVGGLAAALALISSSARGQASPETKRGALTMAKVGTSIGEPLTGAAREKAAMAGQDALIALFKRDPALASPVGYGAIMHRFAGETIESRAFKEPFHYGLLTYIWYYGWEDDGRGGRTLEMNAGRFDLEIVVNAIGGRADANDTLYVDGGPAFIRDYRETGRFRGHAIYDGECVFLTRRSLPPLIPVTKERYLKVQLLSLRADSVRHAGERAEIGNSMATYLAEFLRDRPKREADMRSAYEGMKKFDPAGAEKFKSDWKKSEAESEAQLRAEAPKLDRQTQTAAASVFAEVGVQVRKTKAALDALSPAERKQAAWVVDLGSGFTRLATSADPDSVRLVQVNPAFYDKSLPPAVPQLVSVCMPGLQPGFTPAGNTWSSQRARDAALIRDGLDWTALEAMVKAKP